MDTWFWNVPTLRYLDFSENSLSGPFPESLGNMTRLRELYLYGNNMVGMIPGTLQRLCRLQVVDVSMNHINGDMSEFMDRLPRCVLSRVLRVLHLAATNMSGELPRWIGDMSELTSLDLSYNNLPGGLPPTIGRLSKLTTLLLVRNNLTGRLTEKHFSNMVSLELIDLSQNSMSMEVRPSWRPPCKLLYAYLADVQMGPLFPAWIKHQPDITHLDISHADQWQAAIFSEIHDLYTSDLSRIQQSHRLHPGAVEFGTDFALFRKAIFTSSRKGKIVSTPAELSTWNQLTGTIPQNISDLQKLESLDLSMNELSGEIPSSLSDLTSLGYLNLSYNNLSGRIPSGKQLQVLANPAYIYIGNAGAIPPSLSNLISMDYLNFSYNNLSGRIPSGDQLEVLANPAYIYICNVGLCGPPLSKKCSSADDANSSSQTLLHEERFIQDNKDRRVCVGTMAGVLLLVDSKTWRSAYFRTIDKAYDVLNVFVAIRLAKHDKNNN
ncbi:hypothetical protein PR202_gb06847 [Eleusine coracana subsp. coracana]|uniref:Uncharacterized protein n=1 Tax=Eleusine coracana subsp. coracana TaxID=191504 RepID=A0AAV5E867_ELECO|nr:hypothetical protein PR202_gb06847 [Eleusine coracana subsp. coracana]